MSLINKMLQDLDARGGTADGGLRQQQLQAVPPVERDRRSMLLAGAVLLVLVLAVAAAGWFGWRYWQQRHAATAQMVVAAPPTGKVVAIPQAAPAPQAASAAATASAPVVVESAAKPAKPELAAVALAEGAPAPAATSGHHKSATLRTAVARDAASVNEAQAAAGNGSGTITHDISPAQMSENTYRRALVALQEGRLSAAMSDLERALEINPRNEAARQTYISLLMENKRTDDAVRQLRLALGIDPRQPGLAMVLARLQLESGGPALETLMTTLPYAAGSADYQAFLAGVLQREQRQAEAADHYREALKLSPQNGVWWMGLGISLQADQHLPEAREAFKRARATAGLTPELQAFIDRKLEQLSK